MEVNAIRECGFSDVDRAPDPAKLVRYLEFADVQDIRIEGMERLLAALEIEEGHAVLDVGCGTGAFLHRVASRVGPGGRAAGVDFSETMIEAAKQGAADRGLRLDLATADAARLPFPDGTFDRAAASRVLQHLERPLDGLAEMARVVRPGGRVAVADSDWGLIAIDADDLQLSHRVLSLVQETIRHPWIGRQLQALFHRAGLVDVRVTPRVAPLTDLAFTHQLLLLHLGVERGLASKALTEAEVRAWRADLEERQRTGRFFAIVTGFLAVATKR